MTEPEQPRPWEYPPTPYPAQPWRYPGWQTPYPTSGQPGMAYASCGPKCGRPRSALVRQEQAHPWIARAVLGWIRCRSVLSRLYRYRSCPDRGDLAYLRYWRDLAV